MQNYLQDHDSVRSILEFTRDAQEQTRSKFALHEKPVLRGNVIAESEQDLAELLSRYQQGYYRPNEASLALLSDQEADLSRHFRDDKESCEAQQSLEEGYKRGSMMQMQHVAKARLLMRHPTSQYCNATTNGSSNMTTTTSTSTSSNPHEFHTTTTVSRDLQFRPDFNSIRWPVSLDSIQHPERYQFHETVTEYHPHGPTQMVQDPQWLDSLTPEGQFDWTQGTSNYGLGFGTSPETMDLYDSNLFYKHPLSSTTDFPSSSQSTVISKNPYFHTGSDNPYHYMTPTPSFQDSRTFDDQFRSFDGYYSNCGGFLDSRIEAISGQDSNRSSQEKVPGFHSYGLDESRITRSGMGASFEFLDGLLPPEATAAVRSYPTRNTRGVPTGRTRSRKQEPSQTQGLLKGGSGDHWLLEALSRLPVDGEQSDNCLIWNNEPAESFLLSTENSLKEKSCTTDFRSDHNNNNQQSEFSKLLEKIGLPCQDIGYEGDISHKLSDYCLKSQPTKYSKEDVLELAFCALGKSTASAEELQKVCKVWTANVSNHCLGMESSLESLQFQTSLVSWLGIKHAEVFSRGNRGLRSIEICLQKDSRFIKQDDALWTCTSNYSTRFQELRRAGICAVKRKCNDNKGGKEYSKRKKE